MPEINIRLTLDETNLILQALGKRPFEEVHQLIAKIHQQAQRQVQAAQASPPASTTMVTRNGGHNER